MRRWSLLIVINWLMFSVNRIERFWPTIFLRKIRCHLAGWRASGGSIHVGMKVLGPELAWTCVVGRDRFDLCPEGRV